MAPRQVKPILPNNTYIFPDLRKNQALEMGKKNRKNLEIRKNNKEK